MRTIEKVFSVGIHSMRNQYKKRIDNIKGMFVVDQKCSTKAFLGALGGQGRSKVENKTLGHPWWPSWLAFGGLESDLEKGAEMS